jgi:beta-phosphoglucomutase-like phosphatase (HAD superfamily)
MIDRDSCRGSQKSHVDIKRETNPELFALVDAVVCGDDPRIKAGKPEPYIFLAAAEELGIPPTRCAQRNMTWSLVFLRAKMC